jgi:hypothetical protein
MCEKKIAFLAFYLTLKCTKAICVYDLRKLTNNNNNNNNNMDCKIHQLFLCSATDCSEAMKFLNVLQFTSIGFKLAVCPSKMAL